MQEHTEMDIVPLPSVTAADALRAPANAHAQRRSALAGFGAALDRALTRPEADRRAGGANEPQPARPAERDDDDIRFAAAQQSAWLAAREARTAERRFAPERPDHAAVERRVDAADARAARANESAPPPRGAPAAAIAMARRIEAARARVDGVERAAERNEAAAARAADTAAAAEAGSAGEVDRSLDALSPHFRSRLERVIARMEAEGHDVSVTETHRDAQRQNQLYEQGRTQPGPVVTWTRNSNHTRGMAADLVVDGSYDNPAGYARLAAIAAEEGLQTLGARDAGHVELRSASPLVRTPAPARQLDPLFAPAGVFGVPQVAAVATVADVAAIGGVAQVAQVAAVAQVAQPGSYAPIAQPGGYPPVAEPATVEGARVAEAAAAAQDPSGEAAAGRAPQLATDAVATEARRTAESGASQALAAARDAARTLAARAVASIGGRGARGGDAPADSPAGDTTSRRAPVAADGGVAGAPFVFEAATRAASPVSGAEATLRADGAGRTERVQALQDAAAAQPLSHVTLRVDGEDGSAARINVGLRGNTVGATIDAADPLAAASMRAHVAELRQALERQGLDPSSLLVRAATRLPEGSDAGKLAAALGGADLLASLATAAGRETTSQRDTNGGQNQQHTATRRDSDAQRQRQNRNGKEDRP